MWSCPSIWQDGENYLGEWSLSPKPIFLQMILWSFSSHLPTSTTKQVPNSPWLCLRLCHQRGLQQGDRPRGSCARSRRFALHIAGDYGDVGAASRIAKTSGDQTSAPSGALGLSNAAFATPRAALVPALPLQGGDRDNRRSRCQHAVRGRLQHRPGPAPSVAYPSGRSPGDLDPPESRSPAPAGVSGNRRGGRAVCSGPGRPRPGGCVQSYPGPAGGLRPPPAGLTAAAFEPIRTAFLGGIYVLRARIAVLLRDVTAVKARPQWGGPSDV